MTMNESEARQRARAVGRAAFGEQSASADTERMFDAASTIVTLLAPFCESADVTDYQLEDLEADLRKRPVGKYDPDFRVDL